MFFYTRYSNSILATLVSALGGCMVAGGIVALFSGEVGVGFVLILIGASMMACAKWISDNKAFNRWWKQVQDANLEPEIAKSTELAVEIYRKNPEKRTLEKIRGLNPSAAAHIERNLSK